MKKTIAVLSVICIAVTMAIAGPPSVKIGSIKPTSDQAKPVSDADRQLLDAAGFVGSTPRVMAKVAGMKSFTPSEGDGGTRQLSGASELFKKCAPSVVALVTPDGTSLGSGTLIDEQGTILTNWHVVEGQTEMHVLFYDPEFASWADVAVNDFERGDVIATDSHRDLALVKLRYPTKQPFVKLGKETDLAVAQDVFAIGHPHEQLWTFTYGVISAIRPKYDWSYGEGTQFKAQIIQTQTPINPGNSGGPLFNEKGNLIGVNSFGDSQGQGLNYAVHLEEFRSFIEDGKMGKFPVEPARQKPTATHASASGGAPSSGASGGGTASASVPDGGVPADANGDGKTDTWCYDTNGNGAYDMYFMDSNGDGTPDAIMTDVDENNVPEAIMADEDGNGTFEHWFIDKDGDGQYETEAWDDNGDMQPDR
ncbi:MAG: trypsin-like peptidase domain-containing protein [bacterium]|nr:trypsin-like peptidase domain-containing protein [bacterium]